MVRLTLTSDSDALVFILLDHHDNCWKRIIDDYQISLKWLVDLGRGRGDYYTHVNLYQLMKNTSYPEVLLSLYFKGLYYKGEIPDSFKFNYAMLSQLEEDGYDVWMNFSSVFDTGWNI